MANALVSLLDVAKRKGSDQAIGLLEDSLVYSPELVTMMGRTIAGTQYKTTHRTLPTVAFRKANDGSATIKSTYTQELKECFIIDAQLQLDQAVADAEARSGAEQSIGDLKFDEARGAVMAVYNTIGTQVWYGTDTLGFGGVASLASTLNSTRSLTTPICISALGATANVQSSAYIVWENLRGAHFIFGNGSAIEFGSLPEWRMQQVLGINGLPLTAYVNNLYGWIGFAVNQANAVARIANIQNTTATITKLTDALIGQALSLLPLTMLAEVNANLRAGGPNAAGQGLKIYMNSATAYGLQSGRTQIVAGSAVDGAQAYPGLVTHSNGVPIVITDSITNTEAVVA